MGEIDRKPQEDIERALTAAVIGEARSFKPESADLDADQGGGSPHDLMGPAGDPAEGKRKPGGDSYPA